MVIVNNYVNDIIDRNLFVVYSFPYRREREREREREKERERERCFKDGTSGSCVRSYLYSYSFNFPLYEFARFISAGRFVKHFCQRIVEYSGNSKNTEDARDVGHKKKYFADCGCLTGKQSG